MKRLIHIPVVHNQADLGSLGESVRTHYLRRLGPAGWAQRQRAVEKFWDDVRRAVDALRLDCRRLRIYQDGLPLCGKEEEIVRELASAGSLNHQLLADLLGKGAALVGTEDPQLLLREYQWQQRRAKAAGGVEPAPSPGEADALLAERDRFIAGRIEATLQDGETGLLFLGAAHRLAAMDGAGIKLETLHRL